MNHPRLILPTPANAPESALPLTPNDVTSWRAAGYALVDGLLPERLVHDLKRAAEDHFPAVGSLAADQVRDFGSAVNFPNRLSGFNELTLHPRIIGAAAQLLGCAPSDLRLSQSDLWPKYGRAGRDGAADNQDQRIHFDYPNHSLVHPAPWDRPEAVEMIVYLSESDLCAGSTAIVPRESADDDAYRWPLVDTPGVGDLRYVNDRASAEAYFAVERPDLADWRQSLYERERLTRYSPGTVLLYRHDVWHRGTPLHPETMRLAQNITYRRAECEWISTLHVGWSWAMYRDDKHMERLIANASLDQRAVLGFPQPGASYWSQATIDAVEARYGAFGFDGLPYRVALD